MTVGLKSIPEHTNWQVNTCLNVLNLLTPLVEQGGGIDGTTLDPNVRTSIESTIIRATNRLDKILDDDKQWEIPADCLSHYDTTLALQNRLLACDVARHEMQVELLTAQHQWNLAAVQQGTFNAPNATVDAQPVAEESNIPAQTEEPANTPKKTTRRKKNK